MHAPTRAAARVAATLLVVPVLSGCARHGYEAHPLETAARPAAIAQATLASAQHSKLLEKLGAPTPLPTTRWTPSQLAAVAVARSAAVTAAHANVVAARAAARVAGAAAPVGLEFEVTQSDALDPGESSRWTVGPRLSLRFSPMDKRRIRADVAGADVLAAEAGVLEAAWMARRRCVAAALDLALTRRERSAVQARLAVLKDAVRLAREQVDNGLSGATEWQLLQLEANNTLIALAETWPRNAASAAELAAALGMSVTALEDLQVEIGSQPPVLAPRADWQRAALTGNAAILKALAAYEQRERELELAVAGQYPDIELSPGYVFDQGDNVWSLLGGLVLPLPARQHAAIGRALAARAAARAAFEHVQTELIGRIEIAYAEAEARLQALAGFRAARDAALMMHDEALALPVLAAADALVKPRARLQLGVTEAHLVGAAIEAQRALAELEYQAAWAPDDALFTHQLAAVVAAAERSDDESKKP